MKKSSKIKFHYNGIKIARGKLQKAHYGFESKHTTGNVTVPTQLTVYARECQGFSVEIAAAMTVKNDSDSHTDYFENDRIRITPDHDMFKAAARAYVWQQEKTIKTMALRNYPQDAKATQKALDEFIAEYLPTSIL